MSGKVQWFIYDNFEAPVLNNTWGCMIDVLDSCLVNGFGAQAITSLVVQDGVGIATFTTAHKIRQFQWVEISGSDEPALNNEFKVIGITADTIEFVVDLPDQTATGSMSCKIASLGWEKTFEGEGKRVYRALDRETNPYYFRVDNIKDPNYTNTYAKFARVGLLETCEGIDDISGNQIPYDVTNPTKNWTSSGTGSSIITGWFKWLYAVGNNTGSFGAEQAVTVNGNRQWIIIGNSSSFYLVNNLDTNAAQTWAKVPVGIGICRKRDVTTPFLLAMNHPNAANVSQYFQNPILISGYANFAFIRNVKGVLANNNIFGTLFGAMSTYSGYAGTVQQDSNDGDVFTDILIKDPSNFLAGVADLAKYVLHDSSTDADFRFVINNGRAYLYCRTATNVTTGASTMLKTALAFDLGEI